MKKLLLLGFILAVCILAMPQGVLADTSKNVAVTAQVESVSNLTVSTEAITWPDFGRGDNTLGSLASPAVIVHVDNNLHYNVQASANNNGFMTDSLLDAYTAPFYLHGDEGNWKFDTITTPQDVVSDGDLGSDVTSNYYFSQYIDNDDSANLGHAITLTFALSPL
jgi:hypothetical protein